VAEAGLVRSGPEPTAVSLGGSAFFASELYRIGESLLASGYLDLIYRAKHEFRVPVAAYNVSGEYSMLRAAGLNGWLDEERAVMEVLTSIKRAGADMILSYFATEVAKRLK
jgi:Delta-aminolevulinic acid dehydratase